MVKRLPSSVPYQGPKERPIGPYIGFLVLEFWLFVGGAALLFWSPLWGGVVLAIAVVLFILAVLFGG